MSNVPEDERSETSFRGFVGGYLAILVAILGLSFALGRLGANPFRAILVSGGALFLVAAIGRPRRLYLIVRSTGWFSLIVSPTVMRTVLGLLGVTLVLAGFLAPESQLPPQ